MAIVSSITGVDDVIRRMKKSKIFIGKEVEAGLKRAGLFLQRESQKVVPVEFGILKNSAGTRSEGSGLSTVVTVFYTASYAVYVHERTELRHAQGKQAKFLEGPAREKRDELLKKISQGVL